MTSTIHVEPVEATIVDVVTSAPGHELRVVPPCKRRPLCTGQAAKDRFDSPPIKTAQDCSDIGVSLCGRMPRRLSL